MLESLPVFRKKNCLLFFILFEQYKKNYLNNIKCTIIQKLKWEIIVGLFFSSRFYFWGSDRAFLIIRFSLLLYHEDKFSLYF